MAKYLKRGDVIEGWQIVALGKTPGYVQLDNGKVVRLAMTDTRIGDYLMRGEQGYDYIDREDFELRFYRPEPAVDPEVVETMIKEVEHLADGDMTLCILTLCDGRKVCGVDNGPNGTQEVREQLAYSKAINELIGHETYCLQGLLAKVGQ